MCRRLSPVAIRRTRCAGYAPTHLGNCSSNVDSLRLDYKINRQRTSSLDKIQRVCSVLVQILRDHLRNEQWNVNNKLCL